MGVVIHPEMQNKILRPMVKELAQLDLPFFSIGQITANFDSFFLKMAKIDSYLAITHIDKSNGAKSFTIGLRILFCISGCITTPKIQNFKFHFRKDYFNVCWNRTYFIVMAAMDRTRKGQ